MMLIPSSCLAEIIKSQINGEFEGFNHGNVYELMNGQAWVQIEQKYYYYYSLCPEVTIFENNGYYYMEVNEIHQAVAVQQVN